MIHFWLLLSICSLRPIQGSSYRNTALKFTYPLRSNYNQLYVLCETVQVYMQSFQHFLAYFADSSWLMVDLFIYFVNDLVELGADA